MRSTGSGMGCPDWPKCFGQWVPPTSVDELPENYKEIYSGYRHKKNLKFARYLRALGFDETADKLLEDKSILEEADFNPAKTWTEYVNRLVGVTVGFMIFAVFVASFRFWKSHRKITLVAFATLVITGFQGWIGSVVVSTNLTPWTITLHMFLAVVIVALLIFLVSESREQQSISRTPTTFWWLITCMAVLLVQILLGTKVREAIDSIASVIGRGEWIAGVGRDFLVHRSFSWVVIALHVVLVMNLRKIEEVKVLSFVLLGLILGTTLSGAIMGYFAVPAFLQPVHLLLANVCFGMQFMLLLKMSRRKERVKGWI